MPINKHWCLSKKLPAGEPVESDFEMKEDHTPDLKKGEILCRALFVSVDPVIRLQIAYGLLPGDVIPGRQIARVIESKHKDYPKAKLIQGSFGWRSYSVIQPDIVQEICGHKVPAVQSLPWQLENSGLPKSSSLGILGITGLSAYISLIFACKVVGGETVVVSSAAGQIGHIIAQIAKILGCRVVGFTGDSDKASWLKTELGIEYVFNYKIQEIKDTLKIGAPNGIDIFIDSVGGTFHSKVLEHMNYRGRVCILGTLSAYNSFQNIPMVQASDSAIVLKELNILGFNVYRYWDKKEEALNQLSDWYVQGLLFPHETIIEGFESLPRSMIGQLEGDYQGKVIVRV